MAAHLQTRSDRWGPFVDVDLAEVGLGDVKITAAYSHAAQMTFSLVAAQHTTPIARLAFIRFWDDSLSDPDGNPQSENNPWFVGYVEEAQPGDDANEVTYTAFDPTFRAAREVTLFDAPFLAGEIPDVPPVPAIGSIPRLVYNVKIDADDDYGNQVGQDGTVAQIIAGLLEFTYQKLYWLDAAPGEDDTGDDVPYLFDDLFGETCEGTSTTGEDLFTSTSTTADGSTTGDGTSTGGA